MNEKQIDFSEYKFKCLKCGNCCNVNLIGQKGVGNHIGFDYKGKLRYKPHIGIKVEHYEYDKLKEYVNISPAVGLFLKKSSICFMYGYQLPLSKSGRCIYFNSKSKKCKIYKYRPIVCKIYPLSTYRSQMGIPDINNVCKAIQNEIKKQLNVSEIPYGEISMIINYGDSFNIQMNYWKEIGYNYVKTVKTIDIFQDLIIKDFTNVNFDLLRKYKILPFYMFEGWIRKNLPSKYVIPRLNELKMFLQSVRLMEMIFSNEQFKDTQKAIIKELNLDKIYGVKLL